MLVVISPTVESIAAKLTTEHPRGNEIFEAIKIDLSRLPVEHGQLIRPPNLYAQVLVPDVLPRIRIRIAYLVGEDDKVLLRKMSFEIL